MRGFNTRRSHEFEHTRLFVYTLHSIYREPNKPFPTMEQYWPLPTDNIEQLQADREEEGKRLQEKLDRFKKRYNKET